ncbi:RNA polymerase sigma factor [uncultured Sphingorhabdus sp.]|uniref:RNA polymerase sigma factor n=1 Tax=uncultured Sphingorhabdus sp. TaxID=1686106 RepID=UPI00261B4984|nr:RNA polymerase sigma factor [uncultured Sphingorhabdus sp.]
MAFLPRLRRFCAVLARNEDRGDDLMQATVERALARIDQWQPGSSLESWMFRIAQNIHIDEVRAQARRGVSVDIDEAVALVGEDGRAIVEERSDLEKARSAMALLPDEQRALMALVVLDGRSYKEAAEILDIPIGTVMSRLARARQSIDRALHGEGQGNG